MPGWLVIQLEHVVSAVRDVNPCGLTGQSNHDLDTLSLAINHDRVARFLEAR